MRIVYQIVWSPPKRRRGRPKGTFNEVIQQNFLVNHISPNITTDRAHRRRLIHKADPLNWDKALLLLYRRFK